VVLMVVAVPAFAGPIADLFKKAPKPKPEERVPQLLITVKTDQDEHKRSQAAEELRQFDPAVFTDIVPTLIDVLRNDKSAGVRVEAIQSLGKLRPVSTEVGQALEQAEKDSSMRVKIQARSSLLQYHLAGYHSPKKIDSPPVLQSGEPPLAGDHHPPPPPPPPVKPAGAPKVVPAGNTGPALGDPPLIVPQQMPPASPLPSSPPQAGLQKPLPGNGPSTAPAAPPQVELPPDLTPASGPELILPK